MIIFLNVIQNYLIDKIQNYLLLWNNWKNLGEYINLCFFY